MLLANTAAVFLKQLRTLPLVLRGCALMVLAAGFGLLAGMVAQAQTNHPLYSDVLPVPANVQTGLDRISQPFGRVSDTAPPRSMACVPTCASMLLNDMNLPVNPEMAGGHYAPPTSNGTSLKSAARDLHMNGGINSQLYLDTDLKQDPTAIRRAATSGRSAILGVKPRNYAIGHAIVADTEVVLNGVRYYVIRDPWPTAPHGGHYLKPAASLEPHVVQVLEPIGRKQPLPSLDPQRPAAGGPFRGLDLAGATGAKPAAGGQSGTGVGPLASAGNAPSFPQRCVMAFKRIPGVLDSWDKALQAKLGISSDLSKLSPSRQQFNAAAKSLAPMLDTVAMGIAVGGAGLALKDYFDHLAKATSPGTTDVEAQQHFERANQVALDMIDNGTWGIGWALFGKASPTGAAILGSGMIGYSGGRWLLQNTRTGRDIESAAGGVFDRMLGNKDDGGGPLDENQARRLMESYRGAISGDQIKLRSGASMQQLEAAVKAGDFARIHGSLLQDVPDPAASGCGPSDDVRAWMTGTFDTGGGVMKLTPAGGTYEYQGGRMTVEKIEGRIVEGRWEQKMSGGKCPDGSYHGRFRLTFSENSFTGVFGYCAEEPSRHGGFQGKRRGS